MTTLRSLFPWLAAGAGAALLLLAALFPYHRQILTKLFSLVRDPTDGSMSSKRVAGLSMIAGGIAAALWHPDQATSAAVLIAGGCTALGIASNADGTTAVASAAAALRGVLKPAGGDP